MKTIMRTIVCCIALGLFLFTQGENVWAKNAKLYVDAAALQGGDGSKHAPFRRITDAVNTARAIWLADSKAKTKIEIDVEPGIYVGSYSNTDPNKEDLPITLDIPGLKLTGSTSMLEDDDDLPTGVFESGKESLLKAQPSLTSNQSLIIIASTSSVLTGQSVEVSQFSFNIGYSTIPQTGTGILIERVQGFAIRNNYVSGGGVGGLDVRASSGTIQGNYMTSLGYGALISAGNTSSPAQVVFSGNRAVSNYSGGLFLGGDITGSGFDSLSATVSGNDLSNNNTNANQGFGIRVIVVKHDPPDPATSGNVTATISNNRISNNNFGYLIDAGFPYRIFMGNPDPKLYNGTLNLSFENNEVIGNLRTPALITFTRQTATLTPTNPMNGLSQYKYLERSTYNITYHNGELNGYWFDHPVSDPIDGRTLHNTLRINGVEIPNGRYVPFP